MIKKTIIVTFILFAGYSLFVIYLAPKWWYASQYTLQGNIIKAQDYMYGNNDSCENVIVGSSLSCRLIMDSLPQTYNLSFAGLSIYEGLNILTRKQHLPKNVFIEQNEVMRYADKPFISGLNSRILFHLRKSFPVMRADKQPLGVMGEQINIITQGFLWMYRSLLFPRNETIRKANKKEIYLNMLSLQKDSYSQIPDERLIKERFNSLNKYIAKLERRGVNFIFFEMPVDSALNYLPTATTIRQTFRNYYPESKYQYIPIPDSVNYETSDGLHLVRSAALSYTVYLKSKIKD